MKRSIAAGIVAFSVVAGIGAAYAVDAATDDSTNAAPGNDPQQLGFIVPGAFEPVSAGMTIDAAEETGFIEPDPERNEMCQGDFYRWSGKGTDGLDIITADDQVVSLGMRTDALATEDGLTVGSTRADIVAEYGENLVQTVSDYGQPGVLVRDGEDWLGFLFGEVTPDTLTDSAKVTFVEVSTGDAPSLLRDGC